MNQSKYQPQMQILNNSNKVTIASVNSKHSTKNEQDAFQNSQENQPPNSEHNDSQTQTHNTQLEEELKDDLFDEEGITDKEFQRAMQKLKNRGTNAVPPKKSASAYIIFGKEKREEIMRKNPGLKVTEVVKQIAQTWQRLSKQERLKYKEASKRDKERYEKELKALENVSHTLKKPKKCLSAYMIFVKETRPRIVESNPDLGALQVMQEVGKQWQSLTTEQKRYFKQKADKDKVRYLNEQKTYYDEVEKVGLTVGTTLNEEGQHVVSCSGLNQQINQISQKNIPNETQDGEDNETSMLQKRKLGINASSGNQLINAYKRIKTEEIYNQSVNCVKGVQYTESMQQTYDGKPLKANNSIFYFTQALKNTIRQRYPFLNDAQICKAVTYRWNQLSDNFKEPFEHIADEDKQRYDREMNDLKIGHFKGKSKIFNINSQQESFEVRKALEINDDLLILLQVKKPQVQVNIQNEESTLLARGDPQNEERQRHNETLNEDHYENDKEPSESFKGSVLRTGEGSLRLNGGGHPNQNQTSQNADNDKSQNENQIQKLNIVSSNNDFTKNLFSSNQLVQRTMNQNLLSQTIKNLASNLANNINQNKLNNNNTHINNSSPSLGNLQSNNLTTNNKDLTIFQPVNQLQGSFNVVSENMIPSYIQVAQRQPLTTQYIIDENGQSYMIQAQPSICLNQYSQIPLSQSFLNTQYIGQNQIPSGNIIISDNLFQQHGLPNQSQFYINPVVTNPYQQHIEIVDINGVPTQVISSNEIPYIQQISPHVQQATTIIPSQNTATLIQPQQQQQPIITAQSLIPTTQTAISTIPQNQLISANQIVNNNSSSQIPLQGIQYSLIGQNVLNDNVSPNNQGIYQYDINQISSQQQLPINHETPQYQTASQTAFIK